MTAFSESEAYMKKKTKLHILILVVACILLFFPVCLRLDDGGSKVYRSLVGIYEVKHWKQMGYMEGGWDTEKTGITVKVFGMKVFDNTKTEILHDIGSRQEVDDLGKGSLVEDTLGAISTEHFPVDMPAEEMLAKAKEKGFLVTEEFQITSGEEVWQDFFATTNQGTPAVIYLAHYYTLDKERMSEELYEQEKEEYPKIFLLRVSYDGKQYTVIDRPGTEEQPEMVRTYPYLVKFEGKPSSVSALFDRYEYYVLVHDKNVTWKELEWGMFSSQMGDYIDHCRIVSKHINEGE